jgi:Spy/CpxP family protein refolding chaperone
MIKFGTWVSAVVAATVLAASGRAADDEELIAESGAMEIVLLRQHSVQHDLKLTDVHGKKIHSFATEKWKKAREIHKLPAAEQDAKYNELTKENEKFLSSLLTADQRTRLDQIALQVAGLLTAGRPDIASKLKLTSDQKKKLEALHKEAHKEAKAILKEATDANTKHEELKKLHETNKTHLIGLLTSEQKAIWKTLIGPEFKGELHFSAAKKD